MKNTQKIQKASELGTKAFNEGRKSIPAWDNDLRDLQKSLPMGDVLTIKLLQAWIRAWHSANASSVSNA